MCYAADQVYNYDSQQTILFFLDLITDLYTDFIVCHTRPTNHLKLLPTN